MKKIKIKSKEKTYILDVDDILYCKASGSYSVIYLPEKENVVASFNLSQMQARLEFYLFMFRVSQSILVNLKYVKCIHHAERELELRDLTRVSFTVNIRDIEEKLDSLIKEVG
ncbi:LytTR family transcriptional regulator [Sphingobacterium sp. DN00404]|uniref:LytTR family transcriptional regulator n=1 Tax=Sphingobacterium micropteri TaxID=2763501 RepID=A0ABR7YNG5_9SPHI|nr:LytTR family DNA-binding domain-containing protein [Sphingobacterium micropteri]MBD1432869.1 LytTR family transcriptional regulator [Sphingobacterium micropteri]